MDPEIRQDRADFDSHFFLTYYYIAPLPPWICYCMGAIT